MRTQSCSAILAGAGGPISSDMLSKTSFHPSVVAWFQQRCPVFRPARITRKRLSAIEVAGMLRALSGQDSPGRLVQLIYSETEGVPLFVEEVYRYLAEERRLRMRQASPSRDRRD